MDYTFVSLAELDEDGIKRLARLHYAVMPTLLADLGAPMVLRYYQVARLRPDVIGVCAASSSGEILGWALGSPRPDEIHSRLRQPFPWFVVQMLRLTFTRPFVLMQLISSLFSSSAGVPEGSVELTYIGVDPSARKRGLGHALLNAFLRKAREGKYRSAVLSVEEENREAVALYTRAGFETTGSLIEGRFRRRRMELIFRP